jgi:ssDNA thymidine ADP-ribosyltransferase DarT-like protein
MNSPCQAEALVHRHLPVTSLVSIMCRGDAQKTALQAEVAKRGQSLQVVVKPDCYFGSSGKFVLFIGWTDMLVGNG